MLPDVQGLLHEVKNKHLKKLCCKRAIVLLVTHKFDRSNIKFYAPISSLLEIYYDEKLFCFGASHVDRERDSLLHSIVFSLS